MKIGNKRLRKFCKSLLLAAVPGAYIPLLLGLLYSLAMAQAGRDELPTAGNPIGAISCLGLGVFALPGLVVTFSLVILLNSIPGLADTLPLFNSLSPVAQMNCLWVIGFISNIFLWMIPVSIYRYLKKPRAFTSAITHNDACDQDQSA